jgi:hypothetical protein
MGRHCVRTEDFHGPNLKFEDFDDQRAAECDLFVILIGHQRGTCPDGSDKSYPELEYDKIKRKIRRKPRYPNRNRASQAARCSYRESFLPAPPQPTSSTPILSKITSPAARPSATLLTEWLPGNRPVRSLCVIGGMGKSALTCAWLQRDVLSLPLPGAAETGAKSLA